MKIISLNIWGGHLKEALLDFFLKHKDVDIFCLQEVYYKAKERITDETRRLSLDILSDIHKLLPNHKFHFSPLVNNIYGIAMLIKSDIALEDKGEIMIYENPDYPGIGPTHSRNLQWMTCQQEDHRFTVANVHGLWNGKGKEDSPDRLLQSQNIKEFVNSINTPVVLCGDFNLKPNTKSLKLIEQNMRNCITEYKISSTRTSYYPKKERFADYMLLSNDLKINDFKVLSSEVSDHSPLYLDFDMAPELAIST